MKLYDVGSGLTLRKTIEILSVSELTKKELADAKTLLPPDLKLNKTRKMESAQHAHIRSMVVLLVDQHPLAQTSAATATENTLLARRIAPLRKQTAQNAITWATLLLSAGVRQMNAKVMLMNGLTRNAKLQEEISDGFWINFGIRCTLRIVMLFVLQEENIKTC